MEPPKVAPRPALIDQFVVIVGRADEGIFQTFNKFIHPVAPLSGSSYGRLPEFAFPDEEAIKMRSDIRMCVFWTPSLFPPFFVLDFRYLMPECGGNRCVFGL